MVAQGQSRGRGLGTDDHASQARPVITCRVRRRSRHRNQGCAVINDAASRPTPAAYAPEMNFAWPTIPGLELLTLPQCRDVIGRLAAENDDLRSLVAVLQERLKLDSTNSSKPPSSDGPGRGNRVQRPASTRARGAQKGHKGSFRALLDQSKVDQIIDCAPPSVCECGAAVLAEIEPLRHQVFDVPPVRAQVNEYRLFSGCCSGCGKKHRAPLPPGVPAGQIGPRALALIGTLGTHYHLTQFKIRDLLAQMVGVDFSVGAISQAHGKVAQALAKPVDEATDSLAAAPVLNMDETRYPREGTSGNWVWGAVSPKLAVYTVLPSRARYVIDSLIGEQPQGIVVSDRYAGYAHIAPERRQLCWSHYLGCGFILGSGGELEAGSGAGRRATPDKAS